MGDSINYRPKSQEVTRAEFNNLLAVIEQLKAEMAQLTQKEDAPKRGRPAKSEVPE